MTYFNGFLFSVSEIKLKKLLNKWTRTNIGKNIQWKTIFFIWYLVAGGSGFPFNFSAYYFLNDFNANIILKEPYCDLQIKNGLVIIRNA